MDGDLSGAVGYENFNFCYDFCCVFFVIIANWQDFDSRKYGEINSVLVLEYY